MSANVSANRIAKIQVLFWGYSVLWDMEPGFNPTAPTQPGFSAFPYFGA